MFPNGVHCDSFSLGFNNIEKSLTNLGQDPAAPTSSSTTVESSDTPATAPAQGKLIFIISKNIAGFD